MTNQRNILQNLVAVAGKMQSANKSQRVLLVTLHQRQDYQMSAEVQDGAVQCFHGPLDMVEWKDLHRLYDAIRTAIVRAGLVNAELLECDPFMLKSVAGWNPVFQLWGVDCDGQGYDLGKIKAIAERTLAGLKRDAANDADDIFADDLSATQAAAVRAVVLEVLSGNGGKRLAAPVHVAVDDREFKLDGKLGAKLNRANFHAQETYLTGKFFGFDGQKGELFFLTESGQIHMNYEPNLVDLKAVVQAHLDKQDCTIRVHKTISKQGTDVYAFLPDGPLKHQPLVAPVASAP